jgi:glutamate-1-semialdehyde aminotransferase
MKEKLPNKKLTITGRKGLAALHGCFHGCHLKTIVNMKEQQRT